MKAELKPSITANISFILTEPEARALKAITVYGIDSFLNVFYEHLGQAYLKDYENGLRSLFSDINKILTPQFLKIDAARKALING